MLLVTGYGAGNLSHMGVHLIGAMIVLAGGEAPDGPRVSWVVGEAESDEKAAGDDDLRGNGYLAFENGVRGFFRMLPSGAAATPVRHIFPRPQKLWSAGVGQVKDIIACIETGKTPNCSGETGRHLLEIAIAVRESHRRGNARVDLPLADRSLAIRSAETLSGDTPNALRAGRSERRREGVLAGIARSEGIGTRSVAGDATGVRT